MYAALSLAVLAKGPVGVVLPGFVIALFVWCHAPANAVPTNETARWWSRIGRWVRCRLQPLHVWQSIRSLRPLVALVMLSAIALPWYVAVGIETRGEWLEMFLGRHNLQRFASTLDGHRGPIVFYLLAVFVGFFPWSILLPQSVRETVRRLRAGRSFSRGDLFLACWVIAYVGFFSLAGTKLPNYITPCYPALALLTARMIEGYLVQPGLLDRWSWRVALGSLALVGVSLAIGLPIAALTILPGEAWLGVVGCVPIVGAWIAWKLSQQGKLDRALQSLAVTALALALALFGVVVPQVDRHQTSENFVASIRDHDQTPETPFQLMTYRFAAALPRHHRSTVWIRGSPATSESTFCFICRMK